MLKKNEQACPSSSSNPLCSQSGLRRMRTVSTYRLGVRHKASPRSSSNTFGCGILLWCYCCAKKTKASLAEEDETKGGVSLGVCLCL